MLSNILIRVPSVGMALAFWGVLVAGQQTCVAQSGEASFRQLEDQLPTPNAYRAASGAPGAQYWQQRADYDVSVELDDENQRIVGSERITYYNHSPDSLRYLWLQLDANLFSADSDGLNVGTAPSLDGLSFKAIRGILHREGFDSALVIKRVEAANGTDLPHTIVKTMMRIDLPNPLSPGASYEFEVDWSYSLIDAKLVRARSGFEFFPEDGNFIYEVAQWYPRMAA
ncbi:MAG: aminopeptidase, partial [Verrucomicrobia bacterium]|nr:aminopeptidase [Verrucomicrobiota bacterium]